MNLRRPLPCNRRPCGQVSASPTPAPWSPADLSGLAWALSIDGTSQWQDTAQTTPATGDTDPVRRLIAQYGTAIVLDAPSDSARPLYGTAAFPDGKPSAGWDGANDWLKGTYSGVSGARSYGFRFSYVGGTYGRCLYTDRESGGTGTQIRVYSATTLLIQVGVGTTTVASILATLPASIGTGAHTLLVTWDGVSVTSASSYAVEWDGSALSLSAGPGTSVSGLTSSTVHLGAFGNASGAIFFPGHLRRVLHGSGVWGSTDKASIKTWLEA